METATLAIIAGVQVLLLTIVQSVFATRKQRHDFELRGLERQEDYARQDLIADRLVKVQAETIKRTDEVAKVAVETNNQVQLKLTEIHTLVNSDMTAARDAERSSQVLLVLSLKRAHVLSLKLGIPPTRDELNEIVKAEKRIEELTLILADRKAAQDKMDALKDFPSVKDA